MADARGVCCRRIVALCAMGMGLSALWPASGQSSTTSQPLAKSKEPAATTLTVPLRFEESAPGSGYVETPIGPEEPTFRKEPAYQSSKVTRGVLKLTSAPASWISYAWDRNASRVYVDLNRDLDLTNDPTGVFNGQYGPSRMFLDFRAPLTTASREQRWSMHVSLVGPGSSYQGNSSLFFKSGWVGRVRLNGKQWLIVVRQEPDALGTNLYRVGVAPAAPSGAPQHGPDYFSTNQRSWTLDSRRYSIQVKADPAAKGQFLAEIGELTAARGELHLTGTGISQLRLAAPDNSPVLLDHPSTSVLLPEGRYRIVEVALDGDAKATALGPLEISSAKPSILAAGGPLRTQVRATKQGAFINLEYEALGKAGESYIVPPSNTPPRFAIYKGTRCIATGKFEYG